MAAPNSAYRPDKIPLNLDGVDIGDTLIALVELGVTDTIIKDRFFLDGFLSVGDGTASGTTTNHGFIGFCYVGSFNYYMHNLARTSYISAWFNGQEIIIFNDAGLNTLGIVYLLGGGDFYKSVFANYVRADLSYVSAYYVDTFDYGFEYKLQGAGTWSPKITLEGGFIPQQDDVTKIQRLPAYFQPDTIYDVRFYIQNNEGIFYSEVAPILTEDNIIEEIFNKRTAPCEFTFQDLPLYIKADDRQIMRSLTLAPQDLNLFAYTDLAFTLRPSEGWYYSNDDGYSYYYHATFGFTSRTQCEIVPEMKVELLVTVFAAGYWTVTANNVSGNAFPSSVTLTGIAAGLDSLGGVVGQFPYSVTIAANQNSGNNNGSHSVDFVSQLDWITGGFGSSNPSLVQDYEITGSIGTGS